MRRIRSHLTYANVTVTVVLFIVLGGTALAATGSLVNIADPNNAANLARVSSSGSLKVGDGRGPLTVDGTVTAQQATPRTYVHAAAFGLDSGVGCHVLATPPNGRALIVREVRLDVLQNTTSSGEIGIFADTTCQLADLVGDVDLPTIGQTVVPFDPGLGIKAGSAISVKVWPTTSDIAEAFLDGYTVPSSQVPSSAFTQSGAKRQQ